MERKNKYKLILNIGKENETIKEFKNFTKSILDMMENNYILLGYDNFFKKYLPIDNKANSLEKEYYNENFEKYVY